MIRWLFVLSLLLGACSVAPSSEWRAGAPLDDVSNALDDSATRGLTDGFVAPTSKENAAPEETAPDRMLIQKGTVAIETPRPEQALAEVLAHVKSVGGYLASQQNLQIVVRVPADQFDAALAAVKKTGRVLREHRQANDVTEEFVDLGLRIDNAKRARDRLLALLDKATKIEDILKIEDQLRRLTEDIERMEGRRKFLADQVAMATLTVEFAAPPEEVGRPRARQRSRFDWINEMGVEHVVGR